MRVRERKGEIRKIFYGRNKEIKKQIKEDQEKERETERRRDRQTERKRH